MACDENFHISIDIPTPYTPTDYNWFIWSISFHGSLNSTQMTLLWMSLRKIAMEFWKVPWAPGRNLHNTLTRKCFLFTNTHHTHTHTCIYNYTNFVLVYSFRPRQLYKFELSHRIIYNNIYRMSYPVKSCKYIQNIVVKHMRREYYNIPTFTSWR